MKRRKALSILLSAAMLGTIVGGCGGREQEKAPAESSDAGNAENVEGDAETVVLKWALWEKETTAYWQMLADAFEEKNPGIKLELIELGNADYDTVLATELSGDGTEFDVVTIKNTPSYSTLVQKNALLDLTDYIEDDGVDLSQYGGKTELVTLDEKLYQMPFRQDIWVMFYNKDLFDAKGVEYPDNDMTWDEYDELARKVTDTTMGSQVYGTHHHVWSSAVSNPALTTGEHTILDGDYEFLKPYYERVLNQEADGVCRKYSDLVTEGLHYSAAFSSGDVAMLLMGTWHVGNMIHNLSTGEYDSELCGNWDFVRMPHEEGADPASAVGGLTGLSVTSATDVPEEAWKFVEFASGPEGAAVMAQTGNFPAIMSDDVIDIIANLDGFPQDEDQKNIEALKTTGWYLEQPCGPYTSEVNNIIGTIHGSIMTGEVSIDEGIAQMEKEVQAILEE